MIPKEKYDALTQMELEAEKKAIETILSETYQNRQQTDNLLDRLNEIERLMK